MPAITPLNNIKLQSSLNLNNQLLLNTNRAKAYTLKNIATSSKTLDASDIGSLLFFSFNGSSTLTVNTNISGVFAGDSVFTSSPFNVAIPSGGAVVVVDSLDNSINGSFNVIQLIYLGSNKWLQINTN